ncbi:MAG TPA: SpoIIE family protein phosphatase [Syntrophales bacterium]|nr:SpoIIE family protein phosphatase [Syntrophales bacterium]
MKLKIPIRTKLLLAFLGLPVISLVIFGYFAFEDIRQIGNYALESSSSLGDSAAGDSARALEDLGESIITQKARDVALQCRIYLDAHPGIRLDELRKKPDFQKIAVQSVGKTGYTLVYDRGTGLMKFHPNPEIVDFDLQQWRDKLPDFWKIFEKTFDGSPNSGYYDWLDVDGSIRRKYMSIVPVRDSMFMVAATTYIDEFSIPVKETKKRIDATTRQINEHVNETLDDIYRNFFAFLLVLMVIVLGVAVFISRTITRPVLSLIRGAKAIGRGEIDHRVEVQTGDEMEELAAAFNRMTMDLKEHMAVLKQTTADREGLLKELEIARGIQQRLIPDRAPRIPNIDLAANNIPAREVGGDFYDFIPVRDDLWGVVIADVSGKGMPAAMFMGLSRTVVRASATGTLDLAHAIRQANELICRDSTSGMFVTLFYAVVEPGPKLRYVNAGHNPPILLRRDGNDPEYLKTHGIALGVKKDIHVQEISLSLSEGDLVVLYTDGVTEAVDENDQTFGLDRLNRVVRDNRHLSAGQIIMKIQDAVIAFAGGRPQFDDIALVVLKAI